MSENIIDAKEKHAEKRDKIEEGIRATAPRGIPKCTAPSSSHVVLDNKEWYRSFAKISLYALLFSTVCAASVSFALAYVMTRPPETLSYLMDEDGRVVKLESIRKPSLTNTEVSNWAADKILDIHSLTFTDYDDHIQTLRSNFTINAFNEYQKALKSSKSLEKIRSDRLVMWAEPKEAPKIVSAKETGGKFTWVVEMKITQFVGGGEYIANGTEMLATIVIERTSRTRNLSGVVISKYLAKELGSE